MKVGDYVRIENKAGCCYIGKIYNINNYREPSTKYCIDIQAKDFVFIGEEAICKSSPNIIDLIEVGDYVNGHKVFDKEPGCVYIENIENKINHIPITRDNLGTVLTKEQFKSMEYRIGD